MATLVKVLHLLDVSRPSINGYSSRSDAIIRNLRALGVDTCQLTSQKHVDFDSPEEDIGGIPYYRTSPAKGLFVKVPILSYIDHVRHMTARALEVVEKEGVDLLHAHSPMLNGLVALKVRKATGIPVIYEVRAFWEDAAVDTGKIKEWGPQYRLIRAIEQYVFNRVDKVSCICQGLRSEIIGRGVSSDKLVVAPNAVDLTKFVKLEKKCESLVTDLGLADKRVLGFLGSFFKYEGLEYLIQALPEIRAAVPNAHLLLVGGGVEDANLRALTKRLKLTDHVTFTGRVSYDLIGDYYSLVDLLVFPREDIRLTRLVTPLKPLEAMAQGIPVMASDIGGHREMIEHEVTGLLFRPEDSSALAKAAVSALSDEALMRSVTVNGRAYVDDVRNWRMVASVYPPAYEEMLAK